MTGFPRYVQMALQNHFCLFFLQSLVRHSSKLYKHNYINNFHKSVYITINSDTDGPKAGQGPAIGYSAREHSVRDFCYLKTTPCTASWLLRRILKQKH